MKAILLKPHLENIVEDKNQKNINVNEEFSKGKEQILDHKCILVFLAHK